MTQELKERIARVVRRIKSDNEGVGDEPRPSTSYQEGWDAAFRALLEDNRLLSLLPSQSVPEGWQLVPTKPTPAMFAAADEAMPGESPVEAHDNIWAAMLSASPLPDQQGGEERRCGYCSGAGELHSEGGAAFQCKVCNGTGRIDATTPNKSEREAALEEALVETLLSSTPPKPADELSNYAERTPITIRSSSVKPDVAGALADKLVYYAAGTKSKTKRAALITAASLLRTDKEPS